MSLLVRARTTTFGFNALGSPTFDNANSTGHGTRCWAGSARPRNCSAARSRPVCSPGECRMTGITRKRSIRSTQISRPTIRAITPIGRTCSGTTPSISSDVHRLARALGTDFTFGYEYIADTREGQGELGFFGFAVLAERQGSYGDRRGLCGLAKDVCGPADAHRPAAPGLGDQRDAVHLAAGRRARTCRRSRRIFKAAYGTAFRAPSLFDRYGVDSVGYVGNPNCSSRSGRKDGSSASSPMFRPSRAERFRDVRRDLFQQPGAEPDLTVFTPVYTSVNIGSAHIQGFETR